MEKTYADGKIEVDFFELLGEFRHRIWLILCVCALFGAAAGAFSKFVLTPEFKSTAMVYIFSKETTLTSLADLQFGSQLTKDYKIIVTSRRVLNQVIHDMGLDLTYEDLLKKVSINNPPDTRILSISAVDPDPTTAKLIADKVAAVSSDYIGDIMEMLPPKIIETGEVPTVKYGPGNLKNALAGCLFGGVLICAIMTVRLVMNDTIRTEEDVAKYLEISVLASVPLRGGEKAEGKKAMIFARSRNGASLKKCRKKKGGGAL